MVKSRRKNSMDLIVEGKTYINGSFESCCIGVTDGKITAVKKTLIGENRIRFRNQLILPAGIDMHVHFRDPGFTQKEDFFTGSQAAAFGGISCVFDMPNTQPQTKDKKTIEEKIKVAESKSVVDFGVYAGVADDSLENLTEVSSLCSGYKIFMGGTTNALHLKEENLVSTLQKIAFVKKPVLVHAESERCLKKHTMTENDLKDHLLTHPAICEETAIQTLLTLAKQIPVHMHICHLSSCEGASLVKTRPSNVSVGVTPHHLLFDVSTVQSHPSWYKVNPPIRTPFDRETLWFGIKNNLFNVLESDHAPHTLEEKETDFGKTPSGLPGVETMYPVFLGLVKREQIDFKQLLSLLCEKPAELLNVQKGKFIVGNDADFIVVDFKEEPEKIIGENLHSKCKWTPFEGYNALFPSHVFIRGEHIIDNRELVGRKGFGRHINRKQKE